MSRFLSNWISYRKYSYKSNTKQLSKFFTFYRLKKEVMQIGLIIKEGTMNYLLSTNRCKYTFKVVKRRMLRKVFSLTFVKRSELPQLLTDILCWVYEQFPFRGIPKLPNCRLGYKEFRWTRDSLTEFTRTNGETPFW